MCTCTLSSYFTKIYFLKVILYVELHSCKKSKGKKGKIIFEENVQDYPKGKQISVDRKKKKLLSI